MKVDYLGKGKKQRQKQEQEQRQQQRKEQGSQPRQRQKQDQRQWENLENDNECYVCGKKEHFARDCWSRANHDKMVNEVEVENVNAEPGKEYVYTIEHEVNVVNLSQSGCGVNKIEERKTTRDWDPRTHEQQQPGIGTQEPMNKQPGSGTQEPMKVW